MIQVFSIMILIFVVLAIIFLIKIKSVTLQLIKSKEVNNKENQLENDYQFIKGLY